MVLIYLFSIVLSIQLIYLFGCNFILPIFFAGKFSSVYGLRGTGKTSLAQRLAISFGKLGYKVYSNVHLAGTYQLETYDLGVVDVSDPDSMGVLIVDEAGIDLSNRKMLEKSMKGIKEENRKWWKLSRHYGIKTIIILSQAFDYDVTMRRLCEQHFILDNFSFLGFFRDWTRIVQLRYNWDVSEDGLEPVLKLSVVPFFYLWFNRRPTYGLYDSWEAPELPHKDFEYIPVPEQKTLQLKLPIPKNKKSYNFKDICIEEV